MPDAGAAKVDGSLRLEFFIAVARRHAGHQLARQKFNYVSCQCAAAIEALVDIHRLLAGLSEKVTGEIGEAAECSIR